MFKYFFILLYFSIYLNAGDFFEILREYYFPSERFLALEKEKELSQEFLDKIYLKEFHIDNFKFEAIKKVKGKEFQKPFRFCSRVLYLWYNCGIKIWKEREENSLKFSDYLYLPAGSPILCEGFKDNFCYYNQESKNPTDLILPEKLKVLHFSRKIEFCERKPIYCYALNLNYYLNYSLENISHKNMKKIKILIYRMTETAPFNNKRILEIYGKLIE